MICNAKDLSPDQKAVIETLLGRRVQEREAVSVRTFDTAILVRGHGSSKDSSPFVKCNRDKSFDRQTSISDAPIDFRRGRTEESFELIRLHKSSKSLPGRAKKGEVTIPVCGPEKSFVWREDVAIACSWSGILRLEIFYPVQLPFGSEFVPDPNPLIPGTLDSREYSVVQKIREGAFRGR